MRADLACRLREKPGYRRFLRVTRQGLLRIDRAAVAAEARLDGTLLLRSDPSLSAAEVAIGYQLRRILDHPEASSSAKTAQIVAYVEGEGLRAPRIPAPSNPRSELTTPTSCAFRSSRRDGGCQGDAGILG